MHPSVVAAFHAFSVDLEGRLNLMYLCTAGKVTTAMGVMLPTAAAAAALPWLRADGSRASAAEIISEYSRVAVQGCGQYDPIEVRPGVWEVRCAWAGSQRECLAHAGWRAAERVTSLRLAWEDVDRATEQKMATMERELRGVFPDWDAWCFDEQLFGLSWAWAVGPHRPYPKMIAALNRGDFATAINECDINPKRGTIVKRNERNKVLLANAERVRDFRLDPTVVYWPRELAVVDRDAETLRELPKATAVLEEDGGDARRDATAGTIAEAVLDEIARRNQG